jgi:hypothetical protein
MEWRPEGESQDEVGRRVVSQLALNPPLTCSGCHR